jgi:hypothetical protein
LRTLQSFLLVGVVCAATAALLPGCGSTDSGTSGGGAGAATTGAAGSTGTAGAATGAAGAPAALVGDATRGAAAFVSKSCNTCHGDNSSVPPQPIAGAGSTSQGPNITGTKFAGLGGGIGAWTESQFHDAVRLQKNIDGKQLCALMLPFPAVPDPAVPGSVGVSDQDIADLYVFLEKQMATMALQGGYCPTG